MLPSAQTSGWKGYFCCSLHWVRQVRRTPHGKISFRSPSLKRVHPVSASAHRWLPSLLPPCSRPSSSSASPQPSKPHRLLSLRPKTLALTFLSSSSSFSAAFAGRGKGRRPRIPNEWGEKPEPEPELDPEPEPEPPSAPDLPKDEDEWRGEPGAPAAITDELGEKAEPEMEDPSLADPSKDGDELGREGYPPGNGTPVPADDKLGDLKRCLVDSLYGTELGLRASVEDRAEILELISQLEAANPTPAPTESPGLLDGNWILL